MGLKVWLPLNGNLKNNGTSPVTVTNNGATVNTSGKIGSCYSFDGTDDYISFSYPSYSTDISFCLWVKFNSLSGTHLFEARSSDSVGYQPMYVTSSSIQIGGGSSYTNFSYTFTTGKWYHIAVTHNSTCGKCYVNGILIGTSASSIGVNFNQDIPARIGCRHTSVNWLNGYVNDVRVYDECLSDKEIKEISKGLILHYPLTQPEKSVNLVSNSLVKTTSSNYGFATRYVDLVSGTTYTFTANGRTSNTDTSLAVYIYYPDWSACPSVLSTYSTTDVTMRSTFTCVKSGTYSITSYSFKSQSTSGSEVTSNWYKVEEGTNSNSQWSPAPTDGLWSTTEYDTSGNGYNGTPSSTAPKYASGSPRYNGSYSFNGNSFIKSPYSATLSEFSCSFWINPNASNGGYSIIVANNDYPASGFWIASNCESSGLWFYTSAYAKCPVLLTNGTWYHGCFTFNNGIAKWYLNGELKSTTDISSTKTSIPISELTIGNSYTGSSWNTTQYGNISDFRLYATCLSEDDIKLLYNAPISVTNDGSLMTQGEIIEE